MNRSDDQAGTRARTYPEIGDCPRIMASTGGQNGRNVQDEVLPPNAFMPVLTARVLEEFTMIRSQHALKPTLMLLAAALGLAAVLAQAEGDPAPTYQRELQALRYKGCHWTDDMGKNVYECIKKNDGFGTHWCYDETLEKFCPAQLEAAKKAAAQSVPADKPAN
jgi:hypothetical protein